MPKNTPNGRKDFSHPPEEGAEQAAATAVDKAAANQGLTAEEIRRRGPEIIKHAMDFLEAYRRRTGRPF